MQISGSGGGHAAALAQRMFNRADCDRNGGLSVEEFSNAARRGPATSAAESANPAAQPADSALRDAFNGMDANQDGQVSAAEMAAARPPQPPGGALSSNSFNALLESLGQGTDRSTRPNGGHHHPQGRSQADRIQGDDPIMRRMMAAYGERPITTPGSGISA